MADDVDRCAECGVAIVDDAVARERDVSTGFGRFNVETRRYCGDACLARSMAVSVTTLDSRQTRLWQWEVGLDYIDLLYRRMGPDGRLRDDDDDDDDDAPGVAGGERARRSPADA